MKSKSQETPDDANMQASVETEEPETPVYDPIQEKILDSINENYSEKGIDITTIELSSGQHDRARIELKYLNHTKEQAGLAGLCILSENFPKLKGYTAVACGVEYKSDPETMAYIRDNGYTFTCTAEETEQYLDIIENGIPIDEGDSEISAESR
jgi:hypothetical protein